MEINKFSLRSLKKNEFPFQCLRKNQYFINAKKGGGKDYLK
jgi:hypothetical protein